MPKHGYALLVGPDGAGKSTITSGLMRRARDHGVPVTAAHSRPGLLGGRPAGSRVTTTPHEQTPRGIPTGVAKLLLVGADALVGYLLRWRRARRVGLLLVERGWLDMAVDPRRYRLQPRLAWLVEALAPLIPRADVVVVLAGDPAAMHQRKAEIGVHEVARQAQRWQLLAPRAGRRVLRVDTTVTSPDEAVHLVWDSLRDQK